MIDSPELWRWLLAALERQDAAVLLIVVASLGSSPGKTGAKMAVTAAGSVGTIGGGLIETALVKTARAMLVNGESRSQILRRAHHPSSSIQASGMICGGEQTVLIYPCQQKDKAVFRHLLDGIGSRRPVSLELSGRGLSLHSSENLSPAPKFSDGDDWVYREVIGTSKRAFIVGGGHVSLALSKILDTLDFDITVIDERDSPETLQANRYARRKWRIPYADLGGHIPEGEDVFVFIMTHSHRCDERALADLAGKQFAYLGVLGSKHKIATIKQALIERTPGERWCRLHAPMGLAIQSHTPEEIAISIAAEVIKTMNAQV